MMIRPALRLTCLASLVCALAAAPVQSPAHAAKLSDAAFQKLWSDTKVTLTTKPDSKPADRAERKKSSIDQTEQNERKQRSRKGLRPAKSPGVAESRDRKQSQLEVCHAQCSLERMSCDQGNNSFQNRSDQLQAAQSSCFLAEQSCFSRC